MRIVCAKQVRFKIAVSRLLALAPQAWQAGQNNSDCTASQFRSIRAIVDDIGAKVSLSASVSVEIKPAVMPPPRMQLQKLR